MSNPNEWTCTVCGKSKELTGDHLKTKKEVRSDCWPCGTKRLFKKGDSNTPSPVVASVVGVPSQANVAAGTTPAAFVSTGFTWPSPTMPVGFDPAAGAAPPMGGYFLQAPSPLLTSSSAPTPESCFGDKVLPDVTKRKDVSPSLGAATASSATFSFGGAAFTMPAPAATGGFSFGAAGSAFGLGGK
eukprot:PhM_4_TR11254/c0_g1_i3/m.69991